MLCTNGKTAIQFKRNIGYPDSLVFEISQVENFIPLKRTGKCGTFFKIFSNDNPSNTACGDRRMARAHCTWK